MKVYFKLTPDQARQVAADEEDMARLLYKFLGPELTLKLGKAMEAGCEPTLRVIPEGVFSAPAVWTEDEEAQAVAELTAWLAEVDACPHEAAFEIEVHVAGEGRVRTVGVCRHHARLGASMGDGQNAARFDQWEREQGPGVTLN